MGSFISYCSSVNLKEKCRCVRKFVLLITHFFFQKPWTIKLVFYKFIFTLFFHDRLAGEMPDERYKFVLNNHYLTNILYSRSFSEFFSQAARSTQATCPPSRDDYFESTTYNFNQKNHSSLESKQGTFPSKPPSCRLKTLFRFCAGSRSV